MAATRLTMANEALYLSGNNSTLLTQAKTFVDRAYATVQLMRPFRTRKVSVSLNTAIGTPSYALPADYFSTRHLFNTTNDTRIVPFRGEKDFAKASRTQQASPAHYFITESALWLRPKPDAIYALSHAYWRTLPTLTDGDAHLLGSDAWDMPIVLVASSYLLDYLTEHERAVAMRRAARDIAASIEDPSALDLLDHDDGVSVVSVEV